MFKLLRYYSVTSLVAVLATTLLLTWFYRQVAIQGIVQLAERNNLTLARTALNSVRPALNDYLISAAEPGFIKIGHHLPPPELAAAIRTLMRDNSVVRIKIYNQQGVVAFSTKTGQVGRNQRDNPGFISAIDGRIANTLIYRDTFNSFDKESEEDNLLQTYIPVQASPAEPIQGVFELYTDVNGLVLQTERTQFIIMAGAILILSTLYAVLVLIVRRANRTIELQQRTIRERTETLEVLSAHMLKREELYKQKIAFELNEGLAQTLSAVKMQVESHRRNQKVDKTADGSIIPILQDAIQEIRSIATDMRPPSLDDLGLLPTINGLCREFEQQHPGIRIERQTPLQEQDVPPPLKVILYRIIVSVLDDLAQHTSTGRIHLALWLKDDTLILLIDDTATDALDKTAIPLSNIDPQLRTGFARMEELTTLSGGLFTASHHSGGGTTLRAAWNR
jgi:signal transduction histidine kinase